MDPQEAMFDPIGTGKMSEEKREPQTSSTPRARTTRPATSITTTTTFRSTTKEVFQGWRGYKLQSSTLRNNNKRRKDFFEENSSRKLHPDDATTTTKIQRTRSSTSPTSSPTPTSLPSPTPPTRSSSSRNQKEVVRAEADAEENNMMSSTTIVTERKGNGSKCHSFLTEGHNFGIIILCTSGKNRNGKIPILRVHWGSKIKSNEF